MELNASARRPRPTGRMFMESATGRTSAHPILAVAFDGQFLSFGMSSHRLRVLSDGEREQIIETITKMLNETR